MHGKSPTHSTQVVCHLGKARSDGSISPPPLQEEQVKSELGKLHHLRVNHEYKNIGVENDISGNKWKPTKAPKHEKATAWLTRSRLRTEK